MSVLSQFCCGTSGSGSGGNGFDGGTGWYQKITIGAGTSGYIGPYYDDVNPGSTPVFFRNTFAGDPVTEWSATGFKLFYVDDFGPVNASLQVISLASWRPNLTNSPNNIAFDTSSALRSLTLGEMTANTTTGSWDFANCSLLTDVKIGTLTGNAGSSVDFSAAPLSQASVDSVLTAATMNNGFLGTINLGGSCSPPSAAMASTIAYLIGIGATVITN